MNAINFRRYRKYIILVSICGIILFLFFIITNRRVNFWRDTYLMKSFPRMYYIARVKNQILRKQSTKPILNDDPPISVEDEERGNISCYTEDSNENSFETLDPNEIVKNSIFFLETSCSKEAILTARQACAVESAARMNPNRAVYLFYLSPSELSSKSETFYNLLTRYENIKIRRILVKDYFANTPLEQWYQFGILERTSKWPTSHMSDVLRYLTLWKFGGIYLDLDVVMTKPFKDLINFAGAQDRLNIAAGVIGLSDTGLGHLIADACLLDLIEKYRGDDWSNNGPGVITRVLQKICQVSLVRLMNEEKCHGFEVLPPYVFYPIPYQKWTTFFEAEGANELMYHLRNSKGIHFWNKLSHVQDIRVDEKVPYALIAQKHCPEIFSNCGSTF